MLNMLTIYAIRRTSSLPQTLKTLLLSLAVSDVGVGLLGQLLYISPLVMWLQQNDPGCNTYKGFVIILLLFTLASFLGVLVMWLQQSDPGCNTYKVFPSSLLWLL